MPSPLHKHGTHVNVHVPLPAITERKGLGFTVNTIHTFIYVDAPGDARR